MPCASLFAAVRHRRGDPSRGRKPRGPLDQGSVHFRAYERHGHAVAARSCAGALERRIGTGKLFYHISTDEVYGALELTRPAGDPAGGESGGGPFGEEFFTEETKYDPHSALLGVESLVGPLRTGLPRHVRHARRVVTNCSNNYGPYQFPEKLIPLFINNIRHRKAAAGVRPRAKTSATGSTSRTTPGPSTRSSTGARVGETYNIGGFNEWRNIDLIRVIVRTVDRLLGRSRRGFGEADHVRHRPGRATTCATPSTRANSRRSWAGNLRCNSRRASRRPCGGTSPTRSGWTTSPRGNTSGTIRKCIPGGRRIFSDRFTIRCLCTF